MMYFSIDFSNLSFSTALFLSISWLRISKMLLTSKKSQRHKKKNIKRNGSFLGSKQRMKRVKYSIHKVRATLYRVHMFSHYKECAVYYLVSYFMSKYL